MLNRLSDWSAFAEEDAEAKVGCRAWRHRASQWSAIVAMVSVLASIRALKLSICAASPGSTPYLRFRIYAIMFGGMLNRLRTGARLPGKKSAKTVVVVMSIFMSPPARAILVCVLLDSGYRLTGCRSVVVKNVTVKYHKSHRLQRRVRRGT
jgi:hypothetical protein